jgi:hypothetical protein
VNGQGQRVKARGKKGGLTSAVILARAFRLSFISEISLSTSSMNLDVQNHKREVRISATWDDREERKGREGGTRWMMKSTSLCLSIVSEWLFVIKKEMS